MIIHTPCLGSAEERAVVAARVEFASGLAGMPECLTFSLPTAERNRLSVRGDGFLCAMLLLAMRRGEAIEVRGAVSPRLLEGVAEYQRTIHAWFPKYYRVVDIHCETVAVPPPVSGRGDVLAAFSGGVDSFYTLRQHLPATDPDKAAVVTHALYSHGFDIALHDAGAFRTACASFEPMFGRLGLALLRAHTNAQDFGTRANWGLIHGSTLIGMAHAFGAEVRRLYVPASHTHGSLVPWGSDPRMDRLLSTETLEVVHDGAERTRVEKTEAIMDWPETYETLRVCPSDGAGDANNCCRCEKCVRTMIVLEMAGVLGRFTRFPHPLTRRNIRRCWYRDRSDFCFPRELIRHAAKHGRWDIVLNVGIAMAHSHAIAATTFVRKHLGRLLRRAALLTR